MERMEMSLQVVLRGARGYASRRGFRRDAGFNFLAPTALRGRKPLFLVGRVAGIGFPRHAAAISGRWGEVSYSASSPIG